MLPTDPSLPRAVERSLRFLDEVGGDRLTFASIELPAGARAAEAFALRFAAPERPMLRFLDPDDVRQTMAWLARPRVRTEVVERVVERTVYVPIEARSSPDETPRAAATDPPPPAREGRAAEPSAREERAPSPEMPFAGMDESVKVAGARVGVANVGLGGYLAGLFGGVGKPMVSNASLGRIVASRAVHSGLAQSAATAVAQGALPLAGLPAAMAFPGVPAFGLFSPSPSNFGMGASPSLSPMGGDVVARLSPVIEEAVRRADGGPALILRLPSSVAQVGSESRLDDADRAWLDEATMKAFDRLPPARAAALGQISVVAPDLRIASPDAAASGTAVSMSWAELAKGSGPVDEASLARLGAVLPAGASLIYPALPVGTAGATNLPLDTRLLRSLSRAYGPSVEMAFAPVADRAAQKGAMARPTSSSGGSVAAALVPSGRASASASGGLFGTKGDALGEAGAGQAQRGGALDFLGVPVRLAPSLASDPAVRRERALATSVASMTGGAPARPEAFGLLRQRLFPSVGSVVAEPDLPAWQRRALQVGLRDASPATLMAADARAPKADPAAKPQMDGGPMAQAARPFAPALALAQAAGGGQGLSGRPSAAFAGLPPALLSTLPGLRAQGLTDLGTSSAIPIGSLTPGARMGAGAASPGQTVPRAYGTPLGETPGASAVGPTPGMTLASSPVMVSGPPSASASGPSNGTMSAGPSPAMGPGSSLAMVPGRSPGALGATPGWVPGSSTGTAAGPSPATIPGPSPAAMSMVPRLGNVPLPSATSGFLHEGTNRAGALGSELPKSISGPGTSPFSMPARRVGSDVGPSGGPPSLPRDPSIPTVGRPFLPSFAAPSFGGSPPMELPGARPSFDAPSPRRPLVETLAGRSLVPPRAEGPAMAPYGFPVQGAAPSTPYSEAASGGRATDAPIPFGAVGGRANGAVPVPRTPGRGEGKARSRPVSLGPSTSAPFSLLPASESSAPTAFPLSAEPLSASRAPSFPAMSPSRLPTADGASLPRRLGFSPTMIGRSPALGAPSIARPATPLGSFAPIAPRPALTPRSVPSPMAAEGATFTPPSLPPVRVALPLPTAPSQRPPQDLPVGSPRSPEMRAPEFRVEMPVLKRRAETPSPAAPFGALVTAGAPGARVQRSQEGGSRSAAASVSSRSEVKTGEDHGTRVHLLAREVYGILRRRIRDEMERSRPYGRF